MKLPYVLSKTRQLFVIAIATAVVSLSPVPVVFADSATTCVAPSPSSPGVHVPTGSDAGMYHYDCDQQLWISAHYFYDPQTDLTKALDATIYTYNNTTGYWDYNLWTYVASKGDYVQRTFSVSTPPDGATTIGGPAPVDSVPDIATDNAAAIHPDGNTFAAASTSNGTATAVAIANSVASIATTGNAGVTFNTVGGSATTGDATALATLVNMLQSSGNVFGADGNAVVFNTTITGDVTGDILLDPAVLGAIQPTTSPGNNLIDSNVLNNSSVDTTVNNALSVAASSGDALVAANTTAGSATSGSATAIANVLIFLNSTITSGKSFVGVINIDGNLNGDILLPPQFIDELLASNVPTLSITAPLGGNGSLDTSVSQSINNAVNATASSGNALVDKNTSAGNATTGNGSTNITTFNLTGSTVIGKNALLVFVNVLGTWYGLIFNVPNGATAATLGGDITAASGSSPQTIGQYNTNQTINNTIVATAKSGDASVIKNTNAGNATTGNAKTAVNILNIAQSALSLSDWFGILFINVFGSWTGSFGIDTIAGTITPPSSSSTGSAEVEQSTVRVFQFIPKVVSTTYGSFVSGSQDTPTDISSGSVLAAQHTTLGSPTGRDNGQKQKSLAWMYATFFGIWVVLLAGERIYTKLRRG